MSLPQNRTKGNNDLLLQAWEEEWVTHQPYLLEKGYRLRDRYGPNWTPSWYAAADASKRFKSPDGECMHYKGVTYAYRVSDGTKVGLKLVETNQDIPILRYLNSDPLISDTRNHTVPILDTITVPGTNGLQSWIVMPFLLNFMDRTHPFQYVSEIVEAVGQFLEGLEFMHEHRIAHRDACFRNIMVDVTKLVPNADCFMYRPGLSDDWSRYVTATVRRSVAPLKYYFIDFETAVQYSPEDNHPRCVGKFGQAKDAPELSHTVPYDPFKLDVYQLGSIFHFLFKEYDGMEFLELLQEAMTLKDPEERPTAAQASAYFKKIIAPFSEDDLAQRIWKKKTPLSDRRSKTTVVQKPTLRAKISRLFHVKPAVRI